MKRLGYLLFFYVIVLAGCSRQSVYERLLVEADSLMEQHTNSALHLLESIPEVMDKGDESSRAYYTLLLTQARYKCYQPVPADSLMRSAVRYYEQSGNPSLLCRAYYYPAMPLYEQGRHEEALQLLKKGEELAVHNHDLLYMSKYHESLCMVNDHAKCYDLMLKYAELALNDNKQRDDTSAVIRNLSQISTALYRLGKLKESKDSILQVKTQLHHIDTISKSYILTNIGCLMHIEGDMKSAKKYLKESLRTNLMPHTYAELGKIYAEEGNKSEAEKCWQEALKTSDSQTVLNVLASVQKISDGKIKSVTNSDGRITSFTYGSMTSDLLYTKGTGSVYPVVDVAAPLCVVSRMMESGASSVIRRTDYTYKGLRAHLKGRGLLGFTEQTASEYYTGLTTTARVTDWNTTYYVPRCTSTTTIQGGFTTTSVSVSGVVGYGYNYMSFPSSQTETDIYGNITTTTYNYNTTLGYLNSKRTEFGGSNMYRQTEYTYSASKIGKAYRPLTVKETQKHSDSTQPYTTTTKYTYNSNGLPTKVIKHDGTPMSLTTDYVYNSSCLL